MDLENMKQYDIAVVGAGPAGIMAAITASQNDKSVVLIEKNESIGRKILATGNGRCNITNRDVSAENYHGANKKFINSVLYQYSSIDAINYFESCGLLLKEEDRGRLFPRNDQASSVVSLLEHELEKHRVTTKLAACVKGINKDSSGWKIGLDNNEYLLSKKLILTTGGLAAHVFGSSGDGHYWVKKIGHTVTPIYAALVPVETNETWPSEIQGIKVTAKVSVFSQGKNIQDRTGDLLFTHYGLSGPAVMSQARVIAARLDNESVEIKIDLFPEYGEDKISAILEEVLKNNGAKEVKNALVGILPIRMIPIILRIAKVTSGKKAADINRSERNAMVHAVKHLGATVKKLRPLKEAQVTAGGVSVSEVDHLTLESKIVSGLYFAGEILDVDGDSGGYNLQWAWSSGYVAGKHAAEC